MLGMRAIQADLVLAHGIRSEYVLQDIRDALVLEYSAVTGACLMTTRKIFDQVGGFDNQFDAYYGDSDLCLKIHKAGFRIIFTPFTKLLHEGSFSIKGSGASYYAVESHLPAQ